jgi:hypothetical protein
VAPRILNLRIMWKRSISLTYQPFLSTADACWSACRVGRSFLYRGSLGRGNCSLKNNYFAEQHSATGVCVGEEMSSVWGTD